MGNGSLLMALRTETGVGMWVFNSELHRPSRRVREPYSTRSQTPAASSDGSSVFFGSGSQDLYSLEAETGIPRWRFQHEDLSVQRPRVATSVDDALVFVAGLRKLLAVDAAKGQLSWSAATNDTNDVISSPIVSGDGATVFFGSRHSSGFGRVHALDSRTGSSKWVYMGANIMDAEDDDID